LLLFTMLQMIFGTQVREAVDVISRGDVFVEREAWLSNIGLIDEFHRSFSWTVMIISIWLVWYIKKHQITVYFQKMNILIFVMMIDLLVIGIVLNYFGMPAIFQILHFVGL